MRNVKTSVLIIYHFFITWNLILELPQFRTSTFDLGHFWAMEISLFIIIQPVRAMDMFPLVNIYKLSFCQLKWMNTGPFYKIQTSLSHLLNPPSQQATKPSYVHLRVGTRLGRRSWEYKINLVKNILFHFNTLNWFTVFLLPT